MRSTERGTTVVMLAIFIVGLFTMAALAIDLGVLYTARTSAQHAADAAALAGAYTFVSNPLAVQPLAAIEAAQLTATSNKILGQSVTIAPTDVAVDVVNRMVTVRVARVGAGGVATSFARAIGIRNVDVAVVASAEAGQGAGSTRCLKPVYIPNTFISNLATQALACAADQTLFDKTCTGVPCAQTAYSATQLGQQFVMRPTTPANALTPSHFYTLDFGSGASTYRCALGSCLNYCNINLELQCGSSYPLETGNMVGPTRQGIGDLIGNPADTWGGLGPSGFQYYDGGNTSAIIDSSRSLVTAPVWNNCQQNIVPGTAGQTAMIIGFVQVFVDGIQGQNVTAHLVSVTPCAGVGAGGGGGGGGPGGGGPGGVPLSGPGGVPVRLVQTPQQIPVLPPPAL
ncbi:MAG: pilus assembly protein TadG-related protein [Terriglobales bacterium]